MTTYLAFLRAINLGAKRKFPKDDIVAAVEGLGWTDVRTHINTGNVRFDCPLRSRAKVEAALEQAFAERAGFEVPTIVLTPAELREVAERAEAFGHDGAHYVSFLKQEPSPEVVRRVEELSSAEAVAKVGGRAVHLMLDTAYHQTRLGNATVEKHLGVATNRNLTVVRTLVEKWC
ncbi:DUF1697 domain-containing protein [Nocardioides sp. zg-579]|uniref:DUF1697 domain-containing protein n=1 Tax=Nocardioides marmotae TaxID=2663857 RepID=A0A6I3JFY1_9ACTN|nr:DUF1697 domain-containing protein [Nocardioides marmotae]MCR6033315.1 DUF1697 domain-containing protein [Gordonia jinghuaiqii]MTB96972.1 DUF1697 domain-containing protein [Nocardioides marmotae]QKE00648.1 DUF1697 domain-containing protein [Nocardioides marmotae]